MTGKRPYIWYGFHGVWGMKRSIAITRAAFGLILAAILQLSPAAYAEPLPHERAFADAELADAMVGSLSGGAQGLPKMDQITAAAIAADVANGQFASAFRRVRDYLISKGVAATLGQTASGFMAAVSAGEALGVRAQEHFGRGRLNALYTNLSRDTNAASWPATYQEALRDDVLGQRFDAAILPVVHWLRRQTGQTGSDRYFAEMAYGMMVARRDFEQGCARYGLSGADCTPERLADEEAWHLESIARTHAAEHAADLRLLETARLVREEAEANHARERAERALREAEAQEAALAREAELAAERAAARAEAAREALAALRAQHALPPPAALPSSAISAAIVDTETSENRTLYRVRLTNTASEPIFGVAVDARMRTPAADSGVAIASGGELRTLAPGESLEVSFTGDGALDAVRLYVTGAGQLLGSFDYPMLHESAARDEPSHEEPAPTAEGWIALPAEFRGVTEIEWFSYANPHEGTPGRVIRTWTCDTSLSVDGRGNMEWSLSLPCRWVPFPRHNVFHIHVPGTEVEGAIYRMTLPVSEGRAATHQIAAQIMRFRPYARILDEGGYVHHFEAITADSNNISWTHIIEMGAGPAPDRRYTTRQAMERVQ